jgi:Putative auto-transporter adhesin, head GIN domain
MKKMKTWMALALLFVQGVLCAQKEIALETFTGLVVSGSIAVTMEPGETERALISYGKVQEDEISIEVREGKLYLRVLNRQENRRDTVRATLFYKTLNRVNASHGAQVVIKQTLNGESITADLDDEAFLSIKVQAGYFEGLAHERSIIEVSGQADKIEIGAYTGSTVRGLDLIAKEGRVNAHVGGRAAVNVSETLKSRASTGGDVRYKGKPKETDNMVVFGAVRSL